MLLSLLFDNPLIFLMVAVALIVSISIHEFAHAYVADRLGDPTAKYLGRVTLNPKAHLDPIGTLLLLVAGFGWGKPVPFNAVNLKNPKRDAALISFAGPASNFSMAIILTIIFHILPGGLVSELLQSFLFLTIFYNLILGFFNLIPIHPLDGFKVVNGFLPYNLSIQWLQMAPFGMYILLVLVLTRSIGRILDPVLDFALMILGLS